MSAVNDAICVVCGAHFIAKTARKSVCNKDRCKRIQRKAYDCGLSIQRVIEIFDARRCGRLNPDQCSFYGSRNVSADANGALFCKECHVTGMSDVCRMLGRCTIYKKQAPSVPIADGWRGRPVSGGHCWGVWKPI